MLNVRELNSISELAPWRAVWRELLCQTPRANWFQSLEWLETYWEFYGQDQRLRVLIIEEGHAVVGIVPLCVVNELRRVGPVDVLTYPLRNWGSFYGPIGPNPVAALEAAMQHICRTTRDWDMIELRWVDATGGDLGASANAFHNARLQYDERRLYQVAEIELSEGWSEYWKTRTSSWRNNVRRSERLLAGLGEVRHIRYRPGHAESDGGDPRWDYFEAVVAIASRSWQGKSQTGTTMSHEQVQPFLRATHLAAVRAGALDLNLLLVGNRPVAFAYNYHYLGIVSGLRIGYDEAFAKQGAGTVLMAKMIEDSARRGDHLIDLGPNYFRCKRQWLNRIRPANQYTHYRAGRWRAQALRLSHAVRDTLSWGDTGKLFSKYTGCNSAPGGDSTAKVCAQANRRTIIEAMYNVVRRDSA